MMAGSIPYEVTVIFSLLNPSSRTLWFNQHLKEMTNSNIPGD
jgi:hypothetical protein